MSEAPVEGPLRREDGAYESSQHLTALPGGVGETAQDPSTPGTSDRQGELYNLRTSNPAAYLDTYSGMSPEEREQFATYVEARNGVVRAQDPAANVYDIGRPDGRQQPQDVYDLRFTDPAEYRAEVARMSPRDRAAFEEYSETRDELSGLYGEGVVDPTNEEHAWVKELYDAHRSDPSARLGLTPEEQRVFDAYTEQRRSRVEEGVPAGEDQVVASLQRIARQHGTNSTEYSLALSRAASTLSPQTYGQIVNEGASMHEGQPHSGTPAEPRPSESSEPRGKAFLTGDIPVAGPAAHDPEWTAQRARDDLANTGSGPETRPDIPVVRDDRGPQEWWEESAAGAPDQERQAAASQLPNAPVSRREGRREAPPFPLWGDEGGDASRQQHAPASEPHGAPRANRGEATPKPPTSTEPAPSSRPSLRDRLKPAYWAAAMGNTASRLRERMDNDPRAKGIAVLAAGALGFAGAALAAKVGVDLLSSDQTSSLADLPAAPKGGNVDPNAVRGGGSVYGSEQFTVKQPGPRVHQGDSLTGIMEKMGIPESKWDEVIGSDDVHDALLKTKDGYMEGSDPRLNYWGKGTHLHPETVDAIKEAAGIDTTPAAPTPPAGTPQKGPVAPQVPQFDINDVPLPTLTEQSNDGGLGMREVAMGAGALALAGGAAQGVRANSRRRSAAPEEVTPGRSDRVPERSLADDLMEPAAPTPESSRSSRRERREIEREQRREEDLREIAEEARQSLADDPETTEYLRQISKWSIVHPNDYSYLFEGLGHRLGRGLSRELRRAGILPRPSIITSSTEATNVVRRLYDFLYPR